MGIKQFVKSLRKPLKYCVLLNGIFFLAHCYAVSPIGFGGVFLLASVTPPFIAVISVALLSLPFTAIFLFVKRLRYQAGRYFLSGILYVVVGFSVFSLAQKVRIYGFSKLAERSRSVVHAILSFENHYQHPPSTLQHLVPEFLTEIPTTGMPSYPRYRYVTASTEETFFGEQLPAGNTWALYIPTWWGMYFDMFLYLPNQNYPEYAYSAIWERVGEWAYGHE